MTGIVITLIVIVIMVLIVVWLWSRPPRRRPERLDSAVRENRRAVVGQRRAARGLQRELDEIIGRRNT